MFYDNWRFAKLNSAFNFLGSDIGNKFGAIQSGTLLFTARLRPAEWKPSSEHGVIRTSDGILSLHMFEDALEMEYVSQVAFPVFLLVIYEWADHAGPGLLVLVLRKMGQQRFSRLGRFEFDKSWKSDAAKLGVNDQEKSYTEQLAWLNEGEMETFGLV